MKFIRLSVRHAVALAAMMLLFSGAQAGEATSTRPIRANSPMYSGAHGTSSDAGRGPSVGAVNENNSPKPTAEMQPEPYTVLPFDAVNWSSELKARLLRLVSIARLDGHSVIRLRSIVPDGGSIEFGIALGEKALQRVRNELISLGIKAKQIKNDASRESGNRQGNDKSNGVEVYVDSSPK